MKHKRPIGMTPQRYLDALRELGLTVASQRTADLIGVTVRTSQRMAAGGQGIPDTLALLLGMYRQHGLPKQGEPT